MMKQLSSRDIDRMIERLRQSEGVLFSGDIGYLTSILRKALVNRQLQQDEWARFDRLLTAAEREMRDMGAQMKEQEAALRPEEPEAEEESAALFVRESMRLQNGPDSRRQRGR